MWIKLLLLFFVFSFLFKADHSFDQDLGRHLKLGEIIWQTKSVPKANLFSYTNPDFPFINTHWLFEVWVYLTSQSIGLQSLLVIKILIFLLSIWIILKIIPKEKSLLLLPIGYIFFHVLRERTEFRPEIFSFLFTASTYYILERFLRGPTKLIYLLPAIQLIWINTHIYFFVGLILQAIFLLHLLYHHLRSHIGSGKVKILGIIFVLSVAASLINPNGLAGFLYPLNVTKNYGYTIVENQTIFLLESIGFIDPNIIYAKITIGLTALILLFAAYKRVFEIKNILIAGFGVALALINVRGLPYLVFLSLPAALLSIPASIAKKGFFIILTTLTIILLIFESFSYLKSKPQLKFVENVKAAMDFVISNKLSGPIYNNFDIGSYIIYKGYPNYQVFVDGRPEAYPTKFLTEEYIPSQADYSKFKELDKKYSFKTIIFSRTDQTPWGRNFLNSVTRDNTWKTVYLDNFMIVLVKVI